MNLVSLPYGWSVFFGVPLLLWLIGAGAALRKGRNSPFLAYVAGSDNRLSLSRLQAFLWTLVIFGAFAAAMAVHKPFGTQAEAEQAKAAAQAAQQEVDAAQKARDQANANADQRKTADDNLGKAKDALKEAQQKAEAATKNAQWVNIPAALLTLAGIAIGSGVFSSLIAASNSEDKTACVTSVESKQITDLPDDSDNALTINTLIIKGQNLGNRGRVRFGRISAHIRDWSSDGTQIQVDVPTQLPEPTRRQNFYGPLVVDTPNGKLAYELGGTRNNFKLGAATSYYEFVDLFRDDKSPDNLDLMKFQMFGWTVVAVVIYSFLFLKLLTIDLVALPTVPEGIVILTGLSQTGYLTGKGVANIK